VLYGIGTMIGPAHASPAMKRFGQSALFTITASSHLVMADHAVYRTMRDGESRACQSQSKWACANM